MLRGIEKVNIETGLLALALAHNLRKKALPPAGRQPEKAGKTLFKKGNFRTKIPLLIFINPEYIADYTVS